MDASKWSNDFELLLHCMIPSGISSLWRFPYMVYTNGGGAFWYAYLIVAATIGTPLYYLQLALCQFSSKTNVQLFSQFGLGYTGIAASQAYSALCAIVYYSILTSDLLIYLAYSASARVPPWNRCEEQLTYCVPTGTILQSNPYNNYTISSEIFYENIVLHATNSFNSFPRWRFCVSLMASTWLINFYTSFDVKIGKFAYVMVLFPLVCKFMMCGLASSLKEGYSGIYGFLAPDFSHLQSVKLWYNAIVQCFFSLGIGFGTVCACAAKSSFEVNVMRIAFMAVILDCLACGLVGITVWAVLGHLSYALKVNITELFGQNELDISFILYPIAIDQFSEFLPVVHTVFSMVFYVIVLLCVFILYEVLVTFVSYWYPTISNWKIVLMCSIGCLTLSILLLTAEGSYLIKILNTDCVPILLTFTNLCELLVLSYGYGLKNICLDIQFMQKCAVSVYCRVMWGIVIPLILIMVLQYYLYRIDNIIYDEIVSHCVIRILVISVGIAQIPIWIFYYFYKTKHLGFHQMVREVLCARNFSPNSSEVNDAWKIFKDEEFHRSSNGVLGFFKFMFGK